MSIETLSGVGAAAIYQGNGSTNQVRVVEPAQSVQTEQRMQQTAYTTVQQSQQNNGDSYGGEALKEENIEKSNEKVKKAVSDLNKKMSNTYCQFGIHEGTGRVTIKIVDRETKDIVKEFPAEETLEMIEKVWELAGIMVDEKL